MHVVNDKCCSWLNDLNLRADIKTLQSNESCDWLIGGVRSVK